MVNVPNDDFFRNVNAPNDYISLIVGISSLYLIMTSFS